MTGEPKGLPSAFEIKEQVEGFLSNLEKLKAEGSITEEQYTIAREEYQQRLNAATREIDRIKNELRKQLEATQQDIEACKGELARLENSYRAGELPLEDYQSSQQELRAELEELERDSKSLNSLIEANCSADIGVKARKPQVAAPELPPTEAAVPAKRIKLPRAKLLAAIGGVAVIGVVVAVLLLGPPGAKEGAGSPPETAGRAPVPTEEYETVEVRIPISVKAADKVGSLHLELFYNSEVLHAIHVENGEAAADAMLEYSVDVPGQVVIGMVSSNGISEDGSLAVVNFEIGESAEATTSLELKNIAAHHATTFAEIPTSTFDGIFDPRAYRFGEPLSLQAPSLVFLL